MLDLNELRRHDDQRCCAALIGEDVELGSRRAPSSRVYVDAGQLEQVIMNLVVNARDAMPDGGTLDDRDARTSSSTRPTRPSTRRVPGPHVMLAISDTGAGMDAATRARIFEPFFTTKETGKGTGLGLSTVFGIVEQSGGTIWVTSELGRGTTFKVYLPRADGRGRSATAASGGRRRPRAQRTETILLVEDDEQVRTVDAHDPRATRLHGARGDATAARRCAGLREPRQRQIDLLLTDVVMPRMSGRELAERVARLRAGAEGALHVGLHRRRDPPPRHRGTWSRSSRSRSSRRRCSRTARESSTAVVSLVFNQLASVSRGSAESGRLGNSSTPAGSDDIGRQHVAELRGTATVTSRLPA